MANEWRTGQLGDFITLQRGFDLPEYERTVGNVPVVTSSGISGTHAIAKAKAPGVVMGRYGTIGVIYYVEIDYWPHNTTLYVKDFKGNDPQFVRYFLMTLDYGAHNDKSSVPGLNRNHLHTIPVILPPLAEQRRIAAILSGFDDKIELNRRMNATLEAAARALFKSWFVDFDPVRARMEGRQPEGMDAATAALFPDRLVESALGEIPAGWRIHTVEELAERVAMGPFGSSIKVSTFVSNGIPIISGQHLHNTLLDDSEFNFITEEHAERLDRCNVQRGDIVFTHAGNIGQVAYIPETSLFKRYIISQRQFYLRCDCAKISPLYVVLYFKTRVGQQRLLANTSSSGVPSISQPVSYLRQLMMLVPPRTLLQGFDAIVMAIYRKIAQNTLQSRTLAEARDALLPKLVSGQVRVGKVG